MLITGTGGTDGITVEGDYTVSEVITLTGLVLVGALIWTDVLASFCDIATNADPLQTSYNQTMDDLNVFMSQRFLPRPMRETLREFFMHTRHLMHAEAGVAVLHKMSPDLRHRTALYCYGNYFKLIQHFRLVEDAFLVQLSLVMVPVVLPPESKDALVDIHPDVLYLINKGVVLSEAKALGRGDHFNSDCVLSNPHLRKPLTARAITYLELYTVPHDLLMAELEEFPYSMLKFRMCLGFLALRRALHKMAKLDRATGMFSNVTDFEGAFALLCTVSSSSDDPNKPMGRKSYRWRDSSSSDLRAASATSRDSYSSCNGGAADAPPTVHLSLTNALAL